MSRFPLTLMEEYFLAEDKPAYPCWIFVRARLRGILDRTLIEQAWRETVQRHPTLHSTVRPGANGTACWEPAPDAAPVLNWYQAADVASAAPWTPMDLRNEPAVRLVVAEHATGCELSLEGHHAVFDGAAMFGVLHEILLRYARARGVAVEIPSLRPELFPGRNRFGLGWWDRLKIAPVQLAGLWFAWQMRHRPVAPLAPHRLQDFDAPPNPGFPCVLHQHVTAADLLRLRATARKHGASLNDLLLRDLQAAIGVWRIREGIGRDDDWIFLAVPVNLRRSVDRHLAAANVIGVVAIDRRARSLGDRKRLLRRAHEDMDLVKRHKLGYTFLIMLALWRRRRGGIPRYSNGPGPRATVVMTNVGQPFSRSPLLDRERRIAVPGAVLEDFMMAAPCRPGTCASVAVAIYGGRLIVDLHYDPRALTDQQAETFFAAYFEQLYTSMSEGEA